MGKKIERARVKSKKKMDVLEEALYILYLSQSFGRGMFPHCSGSSPREAIEKYSNDEKMRARAGNKTPYEYLSHLEKLYGFYVNAEFYAEHKESNIKKLNEVLEIKTEMESNDDVLKRFKSDEGIVENAKGEKEIWKNTKKD